MASGASGTFAGGLNTARTNAQGVATAPVFTAHGTVGSYLVNAKAGQSETNPASLSPMRQQIGARLVAGCLAAVARVVERVCCQKCFRDMTVLVVPLRNA